MKIWMKFMANVNIIAVLFKFVGVYMKIVYIGLGSNLGDRLNYLQRAVQLVSKNHNILKCSSIYETAPVGFTEQNFFLNQVICVETNFSAKDLLYNVLQTELELDRKRDLKWGPRTIDIDLLLYDNEIINDDDLILPHPGMYSRRFVLEPLTELCPDLIISADGKTASHYLKEVMDQKVEKLNFTNKNVVFSS